MDEAGDKMIRVCAVCGQIISRLGLVDNPQPYDHRGDVLLTHGLCNEHFLEAMAQSGATAEECVT